MYFLVIFFVIEETMSQAMEDTISVGTVLFSPSDVRKTHWTKSEIGLLTARRYFQDLLPPPNFIDTTNEEYVNTLLQYFKDTYSTIKREATCPVSDSIMTTAFSDALGGYMKLWILPISKLAFYGGTVSQENILKLYQFHNEIKRFMETDGKGWRSPNKNLLHSITVNITPPRHITRRMDNPCQKFVYYEKTPTGLTIPTPYIDWEDQSSTMFIPLRNASLIPLDSPNYQNALFQYYDAAKNCIESSNNPEQYEFDDRFQTWLEKDVVPHLSDDKIYLPLGSILSLVNKSRQMCDRVISLYDYKTPKLHTNYIIAGFPIDLSSKKTLLVIIILFLEVAWCIPALLYLLCARRKKKKDSRNIYTLLDVCKNRKRNDPENDDPGFFQGMSYKIKKSRNAGKGFKIANRPRSENLEIDTQFFPSDSKASDTGSYFGSKVCSAVSVIHEAMPTMPLKSSMKKLRSSHTAPTQQTIIIDPSKSKSNRTTKIGSVKKINKSKKSTPEQSVKTDSKPLDVNTTGPSTAFSSLKQMTELETISNTTHVKSSNSCIKKLTLPEISLHQCLTGELAPSCPCLTCLEAEVGSVITVVNQESKHSEVYSDKNFEANMEVPSVVIEQTPVKEQKPEVPKAKKTKTVGLRLESGRPYLEIKIDKPQAEISVGIGGTFDPLRSLSKKSKIPKRTPKTTAVQMTTGTSPMKKEPLTPKNKSQIPQVTRRPTDDIVIKSSKPKQNRNDDKLNVTL